MFNFKAKIKPEWTKVADLLPIQDRKPFAFKEGKSYTLVNNSSYVLYLTVSMGIPEKDFKGTALKSLHKAGFSQGNSGDLYARFDLPNQYPFPNYLILDVLEEKPVSPEISFGDYIPADFSRPGAYVFKGSVSSRRDLPEDPEVGDVYNLVETGMNTSWTGSSWDDLGPSLDLSLYAKKGEIYPKLEVISSSLNSKASKDELPVIPENISAFNNDIGYLKEHQDLSSYAKVEDVSSISQKIQGKASLADLNGILFRLGSLEDKVGSLSKTNTEVVSIEAGEEVVLEDTEKDYILSGDVSKDFSVSGKSVLLKDTTISDSKFSVDSKEDATFKSVSLSGSYPNNSGRVITLDNSEYITIRDCVFDASACYNMIEIGLDGTTLPKGVLIENCKFLGKYSNNAILIFGTQDNAVININNCFFEDVSNPLRLSNKTDAKNVTVNITNCICNSWDKDPVWSGLLICQDYTSGSKIKADKNNLFAPEKITINVSNLTMPNGEKLESLESMSDICGSIDEKQVFYLWDNYRKTTSYDASKYPSINIL